MLSDLSLGIPPRYCATRTAPQCAIYPELRAKQLKDYYWVRFRRFLNENVRYTCIVLPQDRFFVVFFFLLQKLSMKIRYLL